MVERAPHLLVVMVDAGGTNEDNQGQFGDGEFHGERCSLDKIWGAGVT